MQEQELSLLNKYNGRTSFDICLHPELADMVRDEADLYLSTLESSLNEFPSYKQQFLSGIKTHMTHLVSKSVKIIENSKT